MIVRIDKIRAGGLRVKDSLKVTVPASYMLKDDEVFVSFDGLLDIVPNKLKSLVFNGKIRILARLLCDSCLREVDFEAESDFIEEFCEENPDAWPILGTEIDFSEAVMANVCALLPMKILCKENCLGLCLICGKDLNENICGCEAAIDSPFAALSSLFKSNE
jgi:uncharacterized protein